MTDEVRDMFAWKPMPSKWMLDEASGLKNFSWKEGKGAENAIALMVFYVMCLYSPIRDDPVSGLAAGTTDITYKELVRVTGKSEPMVSRGISLLLEVGLISVKKNERDGRGCVYTINNLDTGTHEKGGMPWCKIPSRKLARKGFFDNIFGDFSLRKKSSLHALKIFFLLLKVRSNNRNYAQITYDNMSSQLGIAKADIRTALTLLIHTDLIHVDKSFVKAEQKYKNNIYWIMGIDQHRHGGTLPRSDDGYPVAV